MGILSTIFGGGIGKAIGEPIDAIGELIDAVHTSDDERLTHAEIMARIKQKPLLAQLAINTVEAGHRSLFVAGWRPGVGWCCVAAMAYMWVLRPIAADVMAIAGDPLPPATLDITELFSLLIPLLGLGGYRTVEKLAGRAK